MIFKIVMDEQTAPSPKQILNNFLIFSMKEFGHQSNTLPLTLFKVLGYLERFKFNLVQEQTNLLLNILYYITGLTTWICTAVILENNC